MSPIWPMFRVRAKEKLVPVSSSRPKGLPPKFIPPRVSHGMSKCSASLRHRLDAQLCGRLGESRPLVASGGCGQPRCRAGSWRAVASPGRVECGQRLGRAGLWSWAGGPAARVFFHLSRAVGLKCWCASGLGEGKAGGERVW